MLVTSIPTCFYNKRQRTLRILKASEPLSLLLFHVKRTMKLLGSCLKFIISMKVSKLRLRTKSSVLLGLTCEIIICHLSAQ